MKFTVHSKETAPKASQGTLEATENAFGFIPNLFGVLAESPAAVEAYASLNQALQKCGLSDLEQQVVALTVSAKNNCAYCVGAHSTVASSINMPEKLMEELRGQQPLSDTKLDALRNFTLALSRHEGWVPANELESFLRAGYKPQHVLDVVTVFATKTLTNYVNHIAKTPLDEAFSPWQWPPKQGENVQK